jgi:hypothetical protein
MASIGTFKGVDITPGTDAEIQQQIRAIESGSALTSASLGAETDIELTQPDAGIKTAKLIGEIGQRTLSLDQLLAQQFTEAQKADEDAFASFLKEFASQEGQSAIQAREFRRQGVDEAKAELTDINQQIIAEQKALADSIRDIRRGGGLESANDARVQQLTRESLETQADLAIIQLSKQGKFDSAREIADRAVTAQMEQQRLKLAALELNYNRVSERFNKTEQRQFELMLSDRNRELNRADEERKEIKNIGLMFLQEGGDSETAKAILAASSPQEALSLTGNILGMTARLQRQKLLADIQKASQTGLDAGDRFNAELKLADTFNDRTKDYQKAAIQIGNIRASFTKAIADTKAGKSINATSQGVLVAFQKLLDPTSVVRESEYARSGEGLSLISRMEGYATRLSKGGAGVSASDLEEFVETAEVFLRGYEDAAIDQAGLIIRQAETVGLNVNNIIPSGVIDLMVSRFEEKARTVPLGFTFTVGGKTYQRVGEDDYIEI